MKMRDCPSECGTVDTYDYVCSKGKRLRIGFKTGYIEFALLEYYARRHPFSYCSPSRLTIDDPPSYLAKYPSPSVYTHHTKFYIPGIGVMIEVMISFLVRGPSP